MSRYSYLVHAEKPVLFAGLLLCLAGGCAKHTGAAAEQPAREVRRRLRPIDRQARQLVGRMRQRGEPTPELHLALAALYARAADRRVFRQITSARKLGISPVRLALVEASALRRFGRYDEALSTLIRVLVHYPEQAHALLALWSTLYEALLRGASLETDVDAVRKRLAEFGLHFPERLDLESDAEEQSRRLTALGYNALLAKRIRYAAELFEAAIGRFPSNARAHRGLGLARAQQYDYTRATGAFLLYLELTPDAPDADEIDRHLMNYWKRRF